MTKTCSRCGVEKSLDDFHAHPNGKHGRTSKCKPCVSEYNRQRYQRNGVTMRASMKAWREANAEKVAEDKRRWRESWTDEYRAERNARSRAARSTPEAKAQEYEYGRQWYLANKEVAHARASAYRARRKGTHGSHTAGDWLNTVRIWGGACAYCGSKDRITKDHVVPLSRGGTDFIGNIVPACHSCNSAKCDRTITEWRAGTPAMRWRTSA